jgi:hypothetical protein
MLSVIMLSAYMVSVIMLSIIMISVNMPVVFRLCAVVLSVVAPFRNVGSVLNMRLQKDPSSQRHYGFALRTCGSPISIKMDKNWKKTQSFEKDVFSTTTSVWH